MVKSKKNYRSIWVDVFGVLVASVIFIIPFVFILFTASKNRLDASALDFTPPKHWQLWTNLKAVWKFNNGIAVRATFNTLILTVFSVALLVIISGMTGYVLQRKRTKSTSIAGFLVLTALIVPPAIVPTIWVLQRMHLFQTMSGMIFIEVAYGMGFAILLYRNFMATIPRELDEAAILDGCSGWGLYFRVIFPLLRPVTITIGIIATVAIFNDFVNPLYFLPGNKNATLQTTLFNFQGQFNTDWQLLFTDILYITVFPLIAFIFFNRKIVAGMTAGSVKG